MSYFPSKISELSPKPVWQFFDKICSIPHPSKHEAALSQFIIQWAQTKGLEVKQDKVGNIFIKKSATPGMENKKAVVLQAHIDMVPQANQTSSHDFTIDPILPVIKEDWVHATETTLGADNGIGMASCLAVLEADDLSHGPLEVLLTVDEEAGMTGAFALESDWLDGEILLNTDSEQEGEIYMGCAGGVNASIILDLKREAITQDFITKKISISGLKGGHSGCDIHSGRGNANKLLGRFLALAEDALNIQLISFTGGSLRNAIPREAHALIALANDEIDALEALWAQYQETIKAELAMIEINLTMQLEEASSQEMALNQTDKLRFIHTLNACPNGVMRMSDEIEGVVETSLNVGVITTDESSITILCLIRSLMDSGRESIEKTLASLAHLASAKLELEGAYPGWQPNPDSPIMHVFRDMYEKIYGHKPNIMVIHAGLECGLFKKPYPNMDMISFGPTIKFPHSPDEKVHIPSVALYWQQLTEILKHIPDKD